MDLSMGQVVVQFYVLVLSDVSWWIASLNFSLVWLIHYLTLNQILQGK